MSQIVTSHPKIVILAGPGESTNILFHALDQEFGIHKIIIETPVSQRQLLKRRVERLGWTTVAGQILFKLLIAKPLENSSQERLRAIRIENNLDDRPISEERITRVASVNAQECIKELQLLQPDVIIVNGTHIIAKKVLTSVSCKFINTRAGITPLYRGVHGGYWALVNNDRKNCGVTVHLVDSGIDTGAVIAQALIQPTEKDNFITYPLLQLAAGLPILKQAIHNALNGEIELLPPPEGKSRLWSHPTLSEYLQARKHNGTH